MTSDGMFDRLGTRISDNDGEANPPSMSDMLDLPNDQRELMRIVLRSREAMTPELAAGELGWDSKLTSRVIGALSFSGMIELVNGCIQIVPMQRVTRKSLGGIWGALDDL
jgi:hypothetical protein